MSANATVEWMMGRGGAREGLSGPGAPPLAEAYAVYLGLFAPLRGDADPLAGFADVLRDGGHGEAYTDEDWINFLLPFVGGDEDAARDKWDGLVCQP